MAGRTFLNNLKAYQFHKMKKMKFPLAFHVKKKSNRGEWGYFLDACMTKFLEPIFRPIFRPKMKLDT